MKNYRFTPYYLSLFYFLFFAWMGVQIPYFNLYLHHIGMSAMEIGIISASIPLMRVFSPALWGYTADRYDKKGMTGKVLWVLSTLSFSLLYFAKSFEAVLIILIIFTFFWTPALPMIEAVAINESKRTGLDYGRIRVWGTIGFVVFSYIIGNMLDYWGDYIIIGTMIFLLIANAAVIYHIPMNIVDRSVVPTTGKLIGVIFQRNVFIFLVAAMLMQFSHSTYYGFLSIYLESLGYSKAMTGLLWALGPAVEIIVMLFATALTNRFSTNRILIFSLMMAVIRWTIFATSDSLAFFIPAQILHAFTFGTFHVAAVHHIQKLFPSNMKNSAQALYSSSSFGLGLVLGMLFSGLFYDRLGAQTLFLVNAMVAFAAMMIIVINDKLMFCKQKKEMSNGNNNHS